MFNGNPDGRLTVIIGAVADRLEVLLYEFPADQNPTADVVLQDEEHARSGDKVNRVRTSMVLDEVVAGRMVPAGRLDLPDCRP